MASDQFGTITLEVGGASYAVAMTIAACAEVETGLGIDSIDDAWGLLFVPADDPKDAKVKTKSLLAFWRAVLRGNGHPDHAADKGNPLPLFIAAMALRDATYGIMQGVGEKPPENPPVAPIAGATGDGSVSAS